MEDPLEPIPSPPSHVLREFLHRALPLLAFAGAGVASFFLWNAPFTGTPLPGEIETLRVEVAAPMGGRLVQLHVDRLDAVTNGQLLATIEVLDPDAVGAERSGTLDLPSYPVEAQVARLKQPREQAICAPMNGIVRVVNHCAGECIPPGAILLVISSAHSEGIVGDVRQPLHPDPQPESPDETHTQDPHPQIANLGY